MLLDAAAAVAALAIVVLVAPDSHVLVCLTKLEIKFHILYDYRHLNGVYTLGGRGKRRDANHDGGTIGLSSIPLHPLHIHSDFGGMVYHVWKRSSLSDACLAGLWFAL